MTEALPQPETKSPAAAPQPDFIELFTRHQRKLYLFILSQVPNTVDAEEILQETNLIIWRKCEEFRPGTNFLAWSSQIARYEVLKFLERRRRDRIQFSAEFIEQIAEEAVRESAELDSRRQALAICLSKLRPKDRELIDMRYAPGSNGLSIAQTLDRPVNSIYQSLARIRRTLLECVTRRLAAEART